MHSSANRRLFCQSPVLYAAQADSMYGAEAGSLPLMLTDLKLGITDLIRNGTAATIDNASTMMVNDPAVRLGAVLLRRIIAVTAVRLPSRDVTTARRPEVVWSQSINF